MGGGVFANKPIADFTSAEVYYRFQNTPHIDPKGLLRQNVENAIVIALTNAETKNYKRQEDIRKSLNVQDISIEQIDGAQIVYASYGDYLFEFRYVKDPSKYHQTPIGYRYWKKPNEFKKSTELNQDTQ